MDNDVIDVSDSGGSCGAGGAGGPRAFASSLGTGIMLKLVLVAAVWHCPEGRIGSLKDARGLLCFELRGLCITGSSKESVNL